MLFRSDLPVREAQRFSGLPATQFNALNATFSGANIPKGDRIVLPIERLGEFEVRMQEFMLRRPPPRGRK